MRRLASTTAFGILFSVLAGPIPAIAQTPAETPDVVVIDNGAKPRRELRYAWTDEQTERVEAVVTVDVAATEGGQSVVAMELPISMTVLAKVTDVAKDGRARIAMAYDDFVFGPLAAPNAYPSESDAAAAAFAESMEQVAPLLSGVRAWQVLDDRGMLLRSGLELPPGFPPEAQERLVQASGSVAVLPDVRVGVGARWESTGATVTQGVSLAVTTTTEITAIDGDEITLSMSMRLADGANGGSPTLDPFETFDLDGDGTVRIDLGGIFPRELAVGMTMAMSGDIPDGAGATMPVEMTIGVGTTMEAATLE